MSLMDKIEDAPAKDKLFVIGVILCSILGLYAVYAYVRHQEDEWDIFARVHKCKKVTEMEEITTYRQGVTVGPDGAMHPSLHTTKIPSASAYVCDDGVTYWR